MKLGILVSIFIILCHSSVLAQRLNFLSPAEVCLSEQIKLLNTSSEEFSRFEWDFCEGDLFEPLQSITPTIFKEIDQAAGIRIVEDGGVYFGFVIDRATNSLYRLDFGLSLTNTPVNHKVDLPTGVTLSSPQGINLIRVSNLWYGFISSFGNNKVFRLDFGLSLINVPTSVEIDFESHLNSPTEIEIVKDGADYFLIILNFNANNLVAANLGSSINNNSPSSFQVTTVIGSSGLYGFSIRKYADGKWRGIVGSYSNSSFQSVIFEGGLNSTASVVNLTSILPSIQNPVKLSLANWGEENVLLVMAYGGSIHRIRFERGSLFSSVNSSDVLINSLGPTLPLSLFYDKGNWKAFTFTIVSHALVVFNFDKTCSQVNMPYYSGSSPPLISFNSTLSVDIMLRANQEGIDESIVKELLIGNEVSPSLDFTSNGNCLNGEVVFNAIVSVPISQFEWSFGDTQTSAAPNPTHQYTTVGDYTVSLQVTAQSDCKNFTEKTIKIYDPPTASFDLPSGLICTNNEFTFINNTTDNFDGNLTYQWLVNDTHESTARDFKYAFTSAGDQEVKLITSIPGCSSELTETLSNVQTGPSVGFSFTGKCEDEAIEFTNQSAGAISGYQWDFGNGDSSSEESPSEIYAAYGNYDVSLYTTGINGCVSTLTKPVSIYSVPKTSFSLDLPPFACSGSLSQFNDATPPMPDSNITSWAWSFGDPLNGSSSQKNPGYTYSLPGDYSVSLTTTSNFGCSNSSQKTVTIYPSPKAGFSFGTACINQGTQFTDLSTGDIKSWLWSVQSNTYPVKNPIHIFKSAATHNTLLTVTGTNNCISQIAKNVMVPVPIVVDFTSQSTCATKPAEFQSLNNGGADLGTSWLWNFANQATATGSAAQHVFPSIGNYSVTMNSTRQSGCTYSVTRTIPITEPPKAQFSVFLDAGAAPFPVDFVNTSLRASAYNWKFGDKANTESNEFSPSFIYTELGEYTAELTVENSLKCMDSHSQLIRVVVPQINAAVSDFKLEKIPGNNRWSSVVTIENKSNVALINPDVYLDISGNAMISEKVMAVIKPNEKSPPYKFTASIAPRSLEFACAEVKVSGDEYAFDNRQCVNLLEEYVSRVPYPNPADDELILEWIIDSNQPMQVIIYNSSGQIIISREYTHTLKGLNQVKVDVAHLATGIYFVSYAVDGQVQNFKFSVAR